MGIFSSSYKYYAYAGSSFLLPEDERKHTVKSLMLQSVIDGSGSLSDAVKVGLQTDMYRRAMKQVKYASKPDGYPYGFPTTTYEYLSLSSEMLRPYIEADIGGPIDFRTLNWGPWDKTDVQVFFTEVEIQNNWLNTTYFPWPAGDPDDTDWSPADDPMELPIETTPPGDYEEATGPYDISISGTNFTVSWPYAGGTFTAAQPFDMSSYDQGEDTWIVVRYRNQGAGDQYRYWYYLIGSNAIPELESAITKIAVESEYLPIAILMHDTVWFDEHSPAKPELEEGLDKLLRYIALDPYDIKEEFIDSIENPDPETPEDQIPKIEDVWDFFVGFSMPLRTRDRAAREYLWRYYLHLKNQTWTSFEEYQSWLEGGAVGDQPVTNFIVEEGEEYTGYIARYAWSYIADRTESGEFTPPGWTRPLKTRECWSEEYRREDPEYKDMLEFVHNATFGAPGEGADYLMGPSGLLRKEGVESTYTVVVRQNKLSEGGGLPTYTAVLMMGPGMEYQINTSEEPVGEKDGYTDYRYRFVDCLLFPEDPEQDSEFRWPINVGVLKDMSSMRREPALQEALAATVFLVDKVKVKWYQKTFFKWLIIIIVVVIIVLAQQYHLLQTISTMASTALAAGATGTAIALAALYVSFVFALGFLISFAGALIGGTWGQVFMIVASIYLAGGTQIFQNIGANFTQMTQQMGWANAASFLNSIQPILNIGQVIIENRALAKLESDMRDFTKTAREKYEELEDAWDQLGEGPAWLEPLDLVASFQASWWAEPPENFYARSLNANPGLLGYDMINRFHEIALRLPQDGEPPDNEFIQSMFGDMERQRGAA